MSIPITGISSGFKIKSNSAVIRMDASVLITFFINNSDGSSLTSLAPRDYWEYFKINLSSAFNLSAFQYYILIRTDECYLLIFPR